MSEWIEKSLGEVTSYIAKGIPPKYIEKLTENAIYVLNQKCNRDFAISYESARIHDLTKKRVADEKMLNVGDVLVNSTGEGTAGRIAQLWDIPYPTTTDGHMITLRPTEEVDPLYYGYAIKAQQALIESLAEGSTGQTEINRKRLQEEVIIAFPKDKDKQNCTAKILENIDKKITINNEINRNLSEQLKAIFVETFGQEISNTKIGDGVDLGELIDVIDNRGKTPPLTTDTIEYPIIDVGALRGDIRVVDFNNCTKFVDEDTYNNWFRSGHPKPWDILLSTVGSLAEMKIFLGEKGCIAQNVVALRSKGISPLYLFQYLQYIRNDLVAYNIGSVQPSIKVTHIIKHPIFVPEENRIKEFDKLARTFTDQIYKLYCECDNLKGIRDGLLPKLMSGELDVSELDI